MCLDFQFLLPKIFGLLLMMAWLYGVLKDMYFYKHSPKVIGNVIEVFDNPDTSVFPNKIAIIEFEFNGQTETIKYSFTGTSSNILKTVEVCINKKKLNRSIVKPLYKGDVFLRLFIPLVFIIFIVISFIRVQGC